MTAQNAEGYAMFHSALPKPLFSLPGLAACLALWGALLCAAPAFSAEPIRVVYGFDREFPPFSYEEAGGAPVGFEVELIKAVLNGANVVLSMRPLMWDMVPLELSSGTINVTSGMVRTEQRAKLYLFSDLPSFPLQIRLFTKVYNRFPSAALLRGQPVSVEKGSYQHRLLENFGGINIKPFAGRVDGIRALYNDEVAAYCGPVQTTYYYINKLNYGAITSVGTPLGMTEMRFAVNKGRGDILRLINDGLKRVVESGEYDRMYRKWFVRELTDDDQKNLIRAATQAAIPAYAPYDAEPQGAAVITATGKIYAAASLENADPALSTTALQSAVARSISEGDFELRAAVIVTQNGKVQPPSAAELQTLYEFGRGILVLDREGDAYVTHMVAQLLPNPVTRPTAKLPVEY